MREAVQHVQDAVERFRKTPCRANRQNRARGALAPSTKARWQWKLRIVEQLAKIFPITDVVVENISARTIKGARKWNRSFSPLEAGKAWFYDRAMRFGRLHLKEGWETKAMRDLVGLKKTKAKLAEKFTAHCVDSWVRMALPETWIPVRAMVDGGWESVDIAHLTRESLWLRLT